MSAPEWKSVFIISQQVLRSLAPRTFHAGVIITCPK